MNFSRGEITETIPELGDGAVELRSSVRQQVVPSGYLLSQGRVKVRCRPRRSRYPRPSPRRGFPPRVVDLGPSGEAESPLLPNPVGRDHEQPVAQGVERHHPLAPSGNDQVRGVGHDLGPPEREHAPGLGELPVEADQDAEAAGAEVEDQKPRVPGSKRSRSFKECALR